MIPILQATQIILLEPLPKPKPPIQATQVVKAEDNPNHCTDQQWIAAEAPFYCIDKPIASIPSTQAQKPVRTAQSGSNGYDYHSCTWHVKQMRPDVPNTWGNATTWLSRAIAQGWSTGTTPVAGAIGWTYGHVVFVERVEGSQVYISERNYDYNGSYRERYAPASAFRYIY